jgi:hypothetical protein
LKGDFCHMGGKKGERRQNDYNFFEIVKKVYEKGINESEVTVQMIMEELKTDLKKIIVD